MPVKVSNLSGQKLPLPSPFTDNLNAGASREYPLVSYSEAMSEENVEEMVTKGLILVKDLAPYSGSVHGVPLNNYAGGGAPTADDDETQGYSVGSLWIDGVTLYICFDAAAGAADWDVITTV